MHVLVVHNPKAGLDAHQVDELVAEITRAGHHAVLASSKEKLDPAGYEIVLAAGGDGTVAKAARYASATGAALGIVPLGTANNIANSFDVSHTALRRVWQNGSPTQNEDKYLRLGTVELGGQRKPFLESVGCGLLAELIGTGKENKTQRQQRYSSTEEELRHRITVLRSLLLECEPKTYSITVDGENYSGQYLLVEVMNISRIGPALDFAPHALTTGSKLDIVLIRPEDDSALLHYLDDLLSGTARPRNFTRKRGRQITIKGHASDFHIDDVCLSDGQDLEIHISVTGERVAIVN